MIAEELKQFGIYRDDLSFKDLTTIKMGGEIAHFVKPESLNQLKGLIAYLKEKHLNFKLIGNGSNLICGSDRYDGVVVSLKALNNYEIDDDEVIAEAGVMVPMLANLLAERGLSGLEFASGIPGTIGGLIYMNAGAYKHSISETIKEVTILKGDEFVTFRPEELDFSYRYSRLHEHPHWVVVSCVLKLARKDPEEIKALINDRLLRRMNTQPLQMPSAGSCFRNPEAGFAWQLIDGIGYRGYRLGGVSVSEKHSNFLVNEGNGTAEEYLDIVYDIQKKVKDKYDVFLHTEVEKFNC